MKASRLILGPVLLALPLWADTVELRTGEKMECLVVLVAQGAEPMVTLRSAGKLINMPLSKVKAIYFDPVDSSTSAPNFHKHNTTPDSTPAKANPEREALQALKALRSLTEVDVNYRDYNLKLADTAAKIESLEDTLHTVTGISIRMIMSKYKSCRSEWWLTGSLPLKCWREASEMIDDLK